MNKNLVLILPVIPAIIAAGLVIGENQNRKTEIDPKTGYVSETKLDLNKMTENINNLGLYKIYDGEVPVKHTYIANYEHKLKDMFKDGTFFGADEEIKIVGKANCYYEYLINLGEAKIETKGDKVVVYVPRAFLNEDTIKRCSKTELIEEESSQNFGSTMALKDSMKEAMTSWEDTFESEAYNKILKTEDKDRININTKSAIRLLMEKFGIKEEDLVVVINE